MDVSITELRANLKAMLDRVKAGESLVITERGRPIARPGPPTTEAEDRLADLVARGIVTLPDRPKPSLEEIGPPLEVEFPSGKTLADYVIENR